MSPDVTYIEPPIYYTVLACLGRSALKIIDIINIISVSVFTGLGSHRQKMYKTRCKLINSISAGNIEQIHISVSSCSKIN